MAYNSQGNLICTRDANGHTTTTGYDPTGTFVTTVTNAQGHVTATAYYGVNGVATTRGVYGQVRSVTDANGAVVSTEYDALGRRTKVTQPDGFWTTTSYVSFGTVGSQHVRTASQLGLSTWTYFDGLGRTITQKSTGPEHTTRVTNTVYDARGAVTRTSVPYDPWPGRVVQVRIDPRPARDARYPNTLYLEARSYAGNAEIGRRTEDYRGADIRYRVYHLVYHPSTKEVYIFFQGRRANVRDTFLRGKAVYVETANKTIALTGSAARFGNLNDRRGLYWSLTRRSADAGVLQQLLTNKTPFRVTIAAAPPTGSGSFSGGTGAGEGVAAGKQWTTSTYDPLGRVLQTTHPDGTRTRACYDDGVTVTLDAKGHKKRTTRDAYGRVVKVEEYTGTYSTCTTARGTPYAATTYVHDRLGNLTTVTDALGNRTTMAYDTLSRKTSMRDPDLGTWTYAYDRHGNLIRQTDAKRQQTHFRYDALHRRTQKDYGTQKAAGAGDVRYTYDGLGYNRKGRLQQVVDTSGTTRFYYDRAGRVTRTDKVVDDLTYTTGQRYDGLGRVTHLSYPASRAAGQAAGTATRVGTATNFGVNVVGAAKMAEHQGTLYLVGSTTAATGTTSALYRLNPTTGVATRVGTATNLGVNEGGVGLASHNGKLYMVGNAADALYTLNPTTGVATRVGTATKFGVNEAVPRAFTSHQGTLYMAGSDTQALYTLNPTTGVATRVGTTTKFGVKETHVRALASYQGALYMVGGVTRRLYRVDPTTGVATPVSRTRGFGQRLNPNGLAAYQGRLYMTINTHNASAANALYTLSPPPPPPRAGTAFREPGTATRVGTAARLGVNEGWMFGLTSHNGTLYMAGTTTDALYTVNPSTGRAARVGTATKFGINEDHPTGLTSHQGKLYMVGYRSRTLYTVNPTTGVATRVGTAGANEDYTLGLASHNGQLYMLGDFANALYTLNTTTGAATRVGTASSFGVNETTPYGLVSHNGDLYMTGAATDALYRLDPATGVATRVGTATKFGVNENYPMELASHHGTLYMLGNSTGALYTLSLSLPASTVTYTYTGPQLQRVQEGSTTYARYSGFNALGQPSTLTLGNGTTTNYTYDSRNYRLKTLRTVKGSTVLQNLGYTFDAAGNVTRLTDTRHGTQTFKYDGLDRLTRATGGYGTRTYAYNQIGNMLSHAVGNLAKRVGTATRFGVNERYPTGVASHNGKLYMVGYDANVLYTVNSTTGVAARVGTATRFGVNEGDPKGLASHNGKLYMVGSGADVLYTVNPTTGVATRVGTATRFGVNEWNPLGLASHNGKLYMVGWATKALYTVNPTTGVATRVGTATRFGVNKRDPWGLASHNGKLYIVGYHTKALHTVNPTTGVATQVGTATGGPRGLASHNNKLYMVDRTAKALYTLNTANTSPSAYTYNPSGPTSTRPHAVTRAGTKTYSYDANGNMLLGDGRIMTYDYENRLSSVRKNGATTTFVYDGDGGRVKKTVTHAAGTTPTPAIPPTTTLYIGQLYVCEGTSCSRLIYAGTQRIALVPVPPSGRTPSPSYFHADHLGSTGVLTDTQGTAEEHNSYEPYGKLHTHTGTSDVAYKYTGQERDAGTGLYFYVARFFDQMLGRFLSPDPLVPHFLDPQAFNRYAYGRNNPVRNTDPTGHCASRCGGCGRGSSDGQAGGGSSEAVQTLPEIVVTAPRLPGRSWRGIDWGGPIPIPRPLPWPVQEPFVNPGPPAPPVPPPPEPAAGRESKQWLGEVSGPGTSRTFDAGTKILIEPYSHTLGADFFYYTVDYRFYDRWGEIIPELRALDWLGQPIPPHPQYAVTGFGLGSPDKPFEALGVSKSHYLSGRVRWRVTIPLQAPIHQNSAGWYLRVYGVPTPGQRK